MTGIDRKTVDTQMQGRTEESYQTKDDSGRFASIFRKDLGDDFPFWKCKEGKHTFDIIPFRVGENYPAVVKGTMQIGDWAYVLDIWVHQGIGPTEDNYVCLARNYHKNCPVCEKIVSLKGGEGADEIIDRIRPKRRTVYNIIVYDTVAEEDKGIQVWEVAHFFMEKNLAAIAKSPRGGGIVVFSSPTQGRSISFEREGSGGQNTKYMGHQFEDRKINGKVYEILDETIEKSNRLDELIVIPTYDQLSEAFYGTSPSGERTRDEEPKDSPDVPLADEKCPVQGGHFGVDTGQLKHCDGCEIYEDCSIQHDASERSGSASSEKKEEPLRKRRG